MARSYTASEGGEPQQATKLTRLIEAVPEHIKNPDVIEGVKKFMVAWKKLQVEEKKYKKLGGVMGGFEGVAKARSNVSKASETLAGILPELKFTNKDVVHNWAYKVVQEAKLDYKYWV